MLALNEIWNLAFFAPRSTRNGFVGGLVFAVPLAALQKAVRDDRVATLALAPYTVWVLVYESAAINRIITPPPTAIR